MKYKILRAITGLMAVVLILGLASADDNILVASIMVGVSMVWITLFSISNTKGE